MGFLASIMDSLDQPNLLVCTCVDLSVMKAVSDVSLHTVRDAHTQHVAGVLSDYRSVVR